MSTLYYYISGSLFHSRERCENVKETPPHQNLQADGVQSRQTLFVRYCLMHINYEILYIVLLFAVNSKKNLHDFFDSCEFL